MAAILPWHSCIAFKIYLSHIQCLGYILSKYRVRLIEVSKLIIVKDLAVKPFIRQRLKSAWQYVIL